MLTTLLTSVGAYIGTTMDDLFVLMLLFSQAEDMPQRKGILQGQCLGIAVLIAASMLGAAGLQLLPGWGIGLMGLIPLALGVREIMQNAKNTGEERTLTAASILRVALLAVANGADNIGVYAPLFAGYDVTEKLLCVLLFMVMTVVLCALAALLSSQPQLKGMLQKYKHVLVPAVLITLGAYILLCNLLPLI